MEIEIKEYEGAGYSPIITYDRWRVAVANYAEKFHPDNFSYMERHLQTDEVFILLQGIATLFIPRLIRRISFTRRQKIKRLEMILFAKSFAKPPIKRKFA